MPKALDLTGQRFGRLVVLTRAENNRYGKRCWLCRCDCGAEKVVREYYLTHDKTLSCGCVQREGAAKRATRHGRSRSRIYKIWCGIVQRCENPNNSGYANYGGRGVEICQEWRKSPNAFCEWALANGYGDNLSIDRIDVNGNYCPENCRWADKTTQNRNQRQRKDHADYSGVRKQNNKYTARIGINGKSVYLGVYDTAEEASEAYQQAKAERDKKQG